MTETAAQASACALDVEHCEAFARDGFVVVRQLFCARTMQDLSRWTDEVVALEERPARHMVYYEDNLNDLRQRVLSRIENFCPYHAQLDTLLNSECVLRLISTLLGERAVMFKDKINFKMPGSDGFKSHQDVQAGWDRYASLHLTMLLSIDSATPDNGCLELAAGVHRAGLLGESWKPLDDESSRLRYIACPTEPGDAVFFDSFVPHRSAANFTDAARRVLYVTYNAHSQGDHRKQYYVDKRLSYPPDIEREPGQDYVFRV